MAALDERGQTPDNPDDDSSYDSDDYPKWASDDEEADSPQHCGSGSDCLNAEVLPSGRKVGALFGTLTAAGVAYVREAIADSPSEVTDLWAERFADDLVE